MLELLLLEYYYKTMNFNGKRINWNKFYKRLYELREEFLEPYVIDPTLKKE